MTVSYHCRSRSWLIETEVIIYLDKEGCFEVSYLLCLWAFVGLNFCLRVVNYARFERWIGSYDQTTTLRTL